MDRYAAYPDTTSGHIVVDTIRDRVVALYPDHRPAEQAAWRLNKPALIAPPRSRTPGARKANRSSRFCLSSSSRRTTERRRRTSARRASISSPAELIGAALCERRRFVNAIRAHHWCLLVRALQSSQHPGTYGAPATTAAATRRTAPSLGLDACATSRHQAIKVVASSAVSVTW
jgi:hypothetical protein